MGEQAPTWLEIEITHPDCWTLEVTEHADVELLSQQVNQVKDDTVKGYFIASGKSVTEVDRMIDDVERSDLTEKMYSLESAAGNEIVTAQGKNNQGFVVEYNSNNSITSTLVDQGFLVQRPVRIHDGVENWTVISTGQRTKIRNKIAYIRDQMDATVNIKRISTGNLAGTGSSVGPDLTARQREVFEHAQTRGYYAWPREVTAKELARDLDITKTTLLEHLHKAESKLLGPHE
ncbi:helix-turn-helix domain-containing protein [Natrononativus amylolyticus]|uniref:helix-turn-helix domain-containing protein n=1 Tax=Natrononativus amylolyticus TaxID=2963434 RepID=UPI0020CBDF02|nr:helix-turn-helix domain-containing protein [Natrononativus amylolyticus]